MKETISKLMTTITGVGVLVFAPAIVADQQAGVILRAGAWLDDGDAYTINVDSRYDLNPSARNPMWVGAGVGAIHRDIGLMDDTDPALNLQWGMDFSTNEAWTPFISSKAVITDESEFGVSFGVRFGQGGASATAQQSESDNPNLASKPR